MPLYQIPELGDVYVQAPILKCQHGVRATPRTPMALDSGLPLGAWRDEEAHAAGQT